MKQLKATYVNVYLVFTKLKCSRQSRSQDVCVWIWEKAKGKVKGEILGMKLRSILLAKP